ncbi:MAG: translational GTPase TypA [Bacteroidota bacterium]|nr:MAG: translational GTPase TypA [Bacteroidota bacterium]
MKPIRNVAIIAHVDHGKTTLVDCILHQCRIFRDNEQKGDLILDSNDLERERGITILAKNVSVNYNDHKINIIDTPGHADFGGEVERVLNMADGVLLLVDAFEGPMPQTRFVLSKAIQMGLKPVVVINKVDKPNCRPDEVQDAVFDLMCHLDANDHQLDFHTIYGSAKNGWMSADWKNPATDVKYLLDQIIEQIPPPKIEEGTLQLKITSLEYSNFIGRIAIGRISRGSIKSGQAVALVKRDNSIVKSKVKELFEFEGLGKIKVNEVLCGDLCAISGIDGFEISDTVADIENPEGLPPIPIDEPTMSMLFTINDSPFFGKEGKFVTSRHLYDRLMKETEKNLALRVEATDSPDRHRVYGRGILHLAILIETMRREGYELQLGKPRVIIKELDGVKCEPVEVLSIDTPEECSGKIIEFVNQRKGELLIMVPKHDLIHLEFEIPARGLIGFRQPVMNISAGEAIISSRFKEYQPLKGDIKERQNGSLVAMESGTSIAFAINKLQDRGTFFIKPGDEVYTGMIVGENTRAGDLVLNVTKTKKLTNMRASGSDDKVRIAPPVVFSLEEAMEYIQDDEYVEVTPKSIRLRKILLEEHERKRAANKSLS